MFFTSVGVGFEILRGDMLHFTIVDAGGIARLPAIFVPFIIRPFPVSFVKFRKFRLPAMFPDGPLKVGVPLLKIIFR